MIILNGYKFIKGKTIRRPWGYEYRFTAIDEYTGREFNEVVLLKTGKETDLQISDIIEKLLDSIKVTPDIEDSRAILEARKQAIEKDIVMLESKKLKLKKEVI